MIDTRVRAIFELNQFGHGSTELIVSGTSTDEVNIMRYISDYLIEKFINQEDWSPKYNDNNAPLVYINNKYFKRSFFLTRGMLTFAGENSTSLGELFGFLDEERFFRIKKGIIDPKFYEELTEKDFEILPISSIINNKMTLNLEIPISEHISHFHNPSNGNKVSIRIEEHGQVRTWSRSVSEQGWPVYGQFTPKGFNKFK